MNRLLFLIFSTTLLANVSAEELSDIQITSPVMDKATISNEAIEEVDSRNAVDGGDLLKNINRYVDDILIKETKSLENSSTKDMLFEVLMKRFDILQKNRQSYIEIYKAFKKTPQYFIKLLPSFLESMIVTAELANFNVNGLKGSVRLKGLIFIYFSTFFQWLDDKNSSLEKTMAELDKNLNQAEKFGKLLS